MFESFTPSRLRLLASTGILCGSLLAASVGSAFAAPATVDLAVNTSALSSTTQTSDHGRIASRLNVLDGSMVAVANLFGISLDTLDHQLATGQTLAQLASQYNTSTTAVQATMLGAITANVTQAMANGQLSQDQATAILSTASEDIANVVNADLSDRLQTVSRYRVVDFRTDLADHPGKVDFMTDHPRITQTWLDQHPRIESAIDHHQNRR